MAKLKIEINDVNNIRDLLQNAYNLADEQIVQAQNEINKLSTSSNLVDEPMDARAKYAKAINDYLSMKDKAISKKIDIAKVYFLIIFCHKKLFRRFNAFDFCAYCPIFSARFPAVFFKVFDVRKRVSVLIFI